VRERVLIRPVAGSPVSEKKAAGREEKEQIRRAYAAFAGRKSGFLLFLLSLLAVLVLVSVRLGSVPLELGEILAAVGNRLFSAGWECSPMTQTIVWELRLPRICMAVVVGSGLAMAGATMQVVLRNPLASPYTLGMASAAGFGAALSLIGGVGLFGGREVLTVANAFFFSLFSSLLVLGLSRMRSVTPGTLVLSGIAMMFLFSASTSLLQYMGSSEEVTAVVFWLMGNLSRSTWAKTGLAAAAVLGTLPVFLRLAWDFNALAAGDETARSFGINTNRIRLLSLILASLVTSAAICFVGTIAFIGLVGPHIARMIVGADHRYLLPGSCLMGAVLLLSADTAARTVLSPIVLPVGILTSFLGVPLFVYLIVKRRRMYW
jgi:iron complex transport system permease protein